MSIFEFCEKIAHKLLAFYFEVQINQILIVVNF